MKTAYCVISYNSKEFTDYVVNALLSQTPHVYVVDNSDDKENRYSGPAKTHYIDGNVGYGGCFDAVLRSNLVTQYDFVGVFNNDIQNIPSNFVQVMECRLTPTTGIAHPGLLDTGCPYPHMRYNPKVPVVSCLHVENVCPVYSSSVLMEYSKYRPSHYYGWIDYAISAVSKQMGLENIVVNETYVSHLRSAVRKKTGNYSEYTNKSTSTYLEWISKRPQLKEMIDTMKGKKA